MSEAIRTSAVEEGTPDLSYLPPAVAAVAAELIPEFAAVRAELVKADEILAGALVRWRAAGERLNGAEAEVDCGTEAYREGILDELYEASGWTAMTRVANWIHYRTQIGLGETWAKEPVRYEGQRS